MYFKKITALFLLLFFSSTVLHAQSNFICHEDGYTIAFLNGVLNPNIANAEFGTNKLRKEFKKHYSDLGDNIDFITLYNPSHLIGIGDISKVAIQKLYEDEASIQDTDLVTIANSLREQLKTQRLLIVAHSQGTLYANELYTYLALDKGELYGPATGIYQVAPAASSGRGTLYDYILSSSDKVITSIPDHQTPNVDLGVTASDEYGHQFVETYLNKAGYTIATDMVDMLEKLETYQTKSTDGKCLGKQDTSVAYLLTKSLLTASDLAINITATGAKGVWNSTSNGYTYLASLFFGGSNSVQIASIAASDIQVEETTDLASPVYLKDERKYPGVITSSTIYSVAKEAQTSLVNSPVSLSPAQEEVHLHTEPQMQTITEVVEEPVSTNQASVTIADVLPGVPTPEVNGSGMTGSMLAAAVPLRTELPLTIITNTQKIYGTSNILISGTAPEGASIGFLYETKTFGTTANAEGKWEYTLTVPRGATTISITGEKDGYLSKTLQVTITSLPGTKEPSVPGRYTKAESPYLLERISTSPEYTTYIEPGTVIKFLPSLANGLYAGCPFYCASAVHRLVVGDQIGEPVILTSSTDDSILGDTNNDDSTTSPQPNSYTWTQSFFAETEMYHVDMRHANQTLYGGKLLLFDYIGAQRGEGISTTYEPGNPLVLTVAHTQFVNSLLYMHSGNLSLSHVSFTGSPSLPAARIGNAGTLYVDDVTCGAAVDVCVEGGYNGPFEQIVYQTSTDLAPIIFTTPFLIPEVGATFGGPVSLIGTKEKPLYIHILGNTFPEPPINAPNLIEQFVIYVNQLGEELKKGWE